MTITAALLILLTGGACLALLAGTLYDLKLWRREEAAIAQREHHDRALALLPPDNGVGVYATPLYELTAVEARAVIAEDFARLDQALGGDAA